MYKNAQGKFPGSAPDAQEAYMKFLCCCIKKDESRLEADSKGDFEINQLPEAGSQIKSKTEC